MYHIWSDWSRTAMDNKFDEISRKANAGEALRPIAGPRTRRSLQPRAYQLTHDIRVICRRNPEGAHRTQTDRLRTLLLCMRGLDRHKKAINLNADDIRLLVHQWHKKHLAASTIRFRLLCLRWLARKIAKPDLVGPDRMYAVDRRTK
jgi:hypothetical protein